jgi:hypothetical protein
MAGEEFLSNRVKCLTPERVTQKLNHEDVMGNLLRTSFLSVPETKNRREWSTYPSWQEATYHRKANR